MRLTIQIHQREDKGPLSRAQEKVLDLITDARNCVLRLLRAAVRIHLLKLKQEKESRYFCRHISNYKRGSDQYFVKMKMAWRLCVSVCVRIYGVQVHFQFQCCNGGLGLYPQVSGRTSVLLPLLNPLLDTALTFSALLFQEVLTACYLPSGYFTEGHCDLQGFYSPWGPAQVHRAKSRLNQSCYYISLSPTSA